MRLLALSALLLFANTNGAPAPPFMKGMTISCPTWGPIWGTPDMRAALQEVKALGVQWASIHPYASVKRDGSLRFQRADDLAFLHRAAGIAKDEGVAMMWKPHLAYWGSFKWRGDITFGDDEAAWRRFFAAYETWIVDQARFAHERGVPLLVVGTELEKTMHREADWRRILRKVRAVYGGMVTYAANWDGVSRVPFWDAVDVIGVQAYYPLAPEGRAPTRAQLASSWKRHFTELRALSKKHGDKRVLFTEVGFARSPKAASKPWEAAEVDRDDVKKLRRLLMDVTLEELDKNESLICGAFWWKWMPGWSPWDSDFSMKDPEARAALKAAWARPG